MVLLQINNMTHYFGGLRAVHGYNLKIKPGQIRGLIGPNGAGKTTVFNLITGIHTPNEGSITFDGKDITRFAPCEIASQGLSRTFQNLCLWRHMTVLDHVKMAQYSPNYLWGICIFRDTKTPQRRSQDRGEGLSTIKAFGN